MFHTQPSLGFPTTLAVSQASTPMDCQQMGRVSFQINSGGTFSYTAAIQQSNDGENWVDVATPAALVAGTSLILEKVVLTTRYCRLNLVRTSGTITGLSAIFNGKF